MKKRILSVFITLCMILTMMPVSAFAADGDGVGAETAAVTTVQPANLFDQNQKEDEAAGKNLFLPDTYRVDNVEAHKGGTTNVNIHVSDLKKHLNAADPAEEHYTVGIWIPTPATATHVKYKYAGEAEFRSGAVSRDASDSCWALKDNDAHKGITAYFGVDDYIKKGESTDAFTVEWYTNEECTTAVADTSPTTYSVNFDNVVFDTYMAKFVVDAEADASAEPPAEGTTAEGAVITVTDSQGTEVKAPESGDWTVDENGVCWIDELDSDETYTYTITKEGYTTVKGTLEPFKGTGTTVVSKNAATVEETLPIDLSANAEATVAFDDTTTTASNTAAAGSSGTGIKITGAKDNDGQAITTAKKVTVTGTLAGGTAAETDALLYEGTPTFTDGAANVSFAWDGEASELQTATTGDGWTLTVAIEGGKTVTMEDALKIKAGTANKLAITNAEDFNLAARDGIGVESTAIPELEVTIQDKYGNTCTEASNDITASLTGAAKCTLGGKNTTASGASQETLTAGVATFDELSITTEQDAELPIEGVKIKFTASGLNPAETDAFRLKEGETTDTTVSLKFTVTNAADNNPISGATVTLTPGDATGNTVTDGTVTIANLDPKKEYDYTVAATGYEDATGKAATGELDGAIAEVAVKLTTADQSAATIEADKTIQAGVSATLPVRDAKAANGDPLSGEHKVTVTGALSGGETADANVKLFEKNVNFSNGTGAINLEPGTGNDAAGITKIGVWALTVTIELDSTAHTNVKTIKFKDDISTVTVVPGQVSKLEIQTPPGAPTANGMELSPQPVVVATDKFGNNCPNETITATVGGGSWTLGGTADAKTDTEGVARFSDLTAESDAKVTDAKIKFTSKSVASVSAISQTAFTIPAPVASLEVTVLDGVTGVGSAVSGVTVTLTGGTLPAEGWTATTNSEGKATFENVPADNTTYKISVSKPGFVTQENIEQEITTANKNTPVKKTIESFTAKTVKVTFTESAKNGLKNGHHAVVTITGSGSRDGTKPLVYQGLSVGKTYSYEVKVYAVSGEIADAGSPGGTDVSTQYAADSLKGTITIPTTTDETAGYTYPLKLESSNTTFTANITVVDTSNDNKGIASATVKILNPNNGNALVASGKTNSQGKVSLKDIPRTNYTITVEAGNYAPGNSSFTAQDTETSNEIAKEISLAPAQGNLKFNITTSDDEEVTPVIKTNASNTSLTTLNPTTCTKNAEGIYVSDSPLAMTKIYKYEISVSGDAYIPVTGEVTGKDLLDSAKPIDVLLVKKQPKYTITFNITPSDSGAEITLKNGGTPVPIVEGKKNVFELDTWVDEDDLTYTITDAEEKYAEVTGSIAEIDETTGGKYDGTTAKTIAVTLVEEDHSYTLTVNPASNTPQSTAVKIFDANKQEILPVSANTYTLDERLAYTYQASADDYVTTTGRVTPPKEEEGNSKTLDPITLQPIDHDYYVVFNVAPAKLAEGAPNPIKSAGNAAKITIFNADGTEAGSVTTDGEAKAKSPVLKNNKSYTYTVTASNYNAASGTLEKLPKLPDKVEGVSTKTLDISLVSSNVVVSTATKTGEGLIDSGAISLAVDANASEEDKKAAKDAVESQIINSVASTELPAETANTIAAAAEKLITEEDIPDAEKIAEEAKDLKGNTDDAQALVYTYTEVTPQAYAETSKEVEQNGEKVTVITKQLTVDVTPKAVVIVTTSPEEASKVAEKIDEGTLEENKDFKVLADTEKKVESVPTKIEVVINTGSVFSEGSIVHIEHQKTPSLSDFFRSIVSSSQVHFMSDSFSPHILSSDSDCVAYIDNGELDSTNNKYQQSFKTLKDAMDAASDGDTIVVTDKLNSTNGSIGDTVKDVTIKKDPSVPGDLVVYGADGKPIKADEDGNINIVDPEKETKLSIPDGTLKGVPPTTSSGKGKVTGVTEDMQYRKKDGTDDWTQIPKGSDGNIELEPGEYEFSYVQKDGGTILDSMITLVTVPPYSPSGSSGGDGDDGEDDNTYRPGGGSGSGGGGSSSGGSGSGGSSSGNTGDDNTGDDKPAAPAIEFTDVPLGAYFSEAVDWAVEKGITNGITETTFGPDNSCTRAQMVTFLWRANGSPEPESASNPFTDIDSSSYYYKAVLWAVEKGITNGTTPTTFSPVQTVNRGQTVTFLYRNAGSPAVTGSNPFTDVAGGMYYEDAVKWAVEKEITTGKTAASFAPNDDCTRAQIVTFLFRNLGE